MAPLPDTPLYVGDELCIPGGRDGTGASADDHRAHRRRPPRQRRPQSRHDRRRRPAPAPAPVARPRTAPDDPAADQITRGRR